MRVDPSLKNSFFLSEIGVLSSNCEVSNGQYFLFLSDFYKKVKRMNSLIFKFETYID